MDFLTDEVIKANSLTEAQVTTIKQLGGDHIAELKKTWDDKANTNAEGILSGAVKYALEKTGVKVEREQGEKWGDYLVKLTDASLSESKTALEARQKEIEEKLKDFKGGDEYKSQIETLTTEKDDLLRQIAELEPLKGFDEKYKNATEELTGLKKQVAYNSVKPSFPDTVNKYEVDAKWNEFIRDIESKNTIEIVEGVPTLIDKENPHKTAKLEDAVKQNETIQELLKGRQQQGTGAKPTGEEISVEGVPFPVKKGANSAERSKAIKEYLTKEGLKPIDKSFAVRFKEYNDKLLKAS